MKILSLFLISLFFASSFQYSTEYAKELRIRDERALDLTASLIAVVDQLIATVTSALNNLLTTVGNLLLSGIASIENAIKETTAEFLLKLAEAQNEFATIIGDGMGECVETVKEEFQLIKESTVEEVKNCYDEGKNNLELINLDFETYFLNNQIIIDNVKATIQNCLDKPSFGEKITCTISAVEVTRDAIFGLAQNIELTAGNITLKIENSVKDSYNCINENIENGETNISELLDGVKECIASLSTTSATTEEITEETEATEETQPTPTEVTEETQPTPTEATEETQPTPTEATEETQPTPTEVTDETQPTPTEVTEETQPTPTEATEETQPTPTEVTEETQPTPTEVTEETQPTPTEATEETQPENQAE